jgi:hypothetical protein
MIQRSIHYKSDFKLRLANEIDWSTPFKLRFFTTRPVSAMEVSYDGTTYKGCRVDEEGKLLVTFDRFTQLHRQGLGNLMMELSYNIDDDQFADNSFDRILAPQKVVCIDDEDNEFELVLGLNGDSHVEVECSVIAAYKKGDPGDTPEIGENGNWWIGGVDTEVKADYSSEEALRQSQEAARVAAETTRQSNETQRQSGETTRQSNEATRQSKETERQTNETARQNAEAQRQQTFQTNEAARQTAYQNAEANRNGAYEEAEQDRDEEFASKEATRDAANQAALNCAETLAALGPEIDNINAKFDGYKKMDFSIEQGDISSADGSDVISYRRLRTVGYLVCGTLKISASSGRYIVRGYDASNQFVGSSSNNWMSGTNLITIQGATKYRAIFSFVNDPRIAPSDFADFGAEIISYNKSDIAVVTPEEGEELKSRIIGVEKSTNNKFNAISEDVVSKNRLNKEDSDVQVGKVMAVTIQNNSNYTLSAPIPVVEGQEYVFSNNGSSASIRYVAFLASSSSTTSSSYMSDKSSFTVPTGAKYVRLTISNTTWNGKPQLEAGSTPSEYQDYFEDYTQVKLKDGQVSTSKIADDAVTENKLSAAVRAKLNAGIIIAQANSMKVVDDMDDGDTLELPKNAIKNRKGISFTAKIASWDSQSVLSVGHGHNDYAGYWLEIDDTNIVVHSYYTSASVVATIPHGLTIVNNIQVKIWKNWESTAHISLCSNGIVFTTTASWLGDNGKIWAKIDDGSLTKCTLGWCSDALTYDNWLFGDSYFNLGASNRWTSYLNTDGHKRNLLNAYPGEASANAMIDLQNLLEIATPKRIIWCQGMNNGDSSNAVNADWKDAYDTLVELCEAKNIDLVLATIPTVVGKISSASDTTKIIKHSYKNAIVRASGYRFIDFESVVGADPATGLWYGTTAQDIVDETGNGMLSSDGLHPTAKGALALYYQACADCPEIMTFEG